MELMRRGCEGIDVLVMDPFCTAAIATVVRGSCFKGVATPSVRLAVELITPGCEGTEMLAIGPFGAAATATGVKGSCFTEVATLGLEGAYFVGSETEHSMCRTPCAAEVALEGVHCIGICDTAIGDEAGIGPATVHPADEH